MCYSKDIIRTAGNVTLPYCYHMWVCPYWVPTKVNCKHTDTEFPHRSWQSGHGRPGGHLGGVHHSWFAGSMETVGRGDKFGASTITIAIALARVLSVRGCKGFGWEQEGGGTSVHGDGGDGDTGLTPIFWCGVFDALFFRKVWGRAWCWCYYLD